MDELVNILANKSSLDNEEDLRGSHPRFADYKNIGKYAEKQRERRSEHLLRIREDREEVLGRYRNITSNLKDDTNLNPFKKRTDRKKHFANILMLSDWLVDIPESLSSEWTMVPSPVGKHCLLVSQNGCTVAYDKRGNLIGSFKSLLPLKTTILDCIQIRGQNWRFYILDMISWAGYYYDDHEYSFRQYFLQQKISEDLEMEKSTTRKNECELLLLSSCVCTIDKMTSFMEQKFDYEIDGLLYYHSKGTYIHGQTPIVGWLKPWMLPEILRVKVPQKYLDCVKHENSQQFIDEFNAKNKHVSTSEKDKKMDTTETRTENDSISN